MGTLAGIVDPDESALAKAREAHPDARTFSSLHGALASGFDAFTVATPSATHFEIADKLLRADRHVLVEKPMALSAAEARELAALAEKKGLTLMVGHVLLFHPAIRRIRELTLAGKIGKIQYLYSNRLNLGTVRKEENILWSFAPHDISIFQHLLETRPVDVVSRGGAFLQPTIHDSTLTILKYPGNVSGHIFVSWLHPFKEHRLVIIGDKGMFLFTDAPDGGRLQFYEKGIDFVRGEPIKRDGPTETIELETVAPLTAELRYFVENLGKGPVKLAGAASGVEVLEILEDATSSLMAGVEARPRRMRTTSYYAHPSSYIDENVDIGEGTKIWHFAHVQSGARIGQHCSIGQNVNIGNNVRVGSHVKIQNNVSVYEGVELDDFVFCGPAMTFTNVIDPRSKYPQRGSAHYLKTKVRTGASIGANATIVCGTTLGRHCFIAAGAVVTKDVPDYALMVGVPARQKGWVCECAEKIGGRGRKRTCRRCQRQYVLMKNLMAPAPPKKKRKKPAARKK